MAKQFYEAAFDWTVQKWDGPMEYWLFTTVPETDAGIDGPDGNRFGLMQLDATAGG